MYKELFRNSKAALLFAGMTVLSAVVLIGSPEDKGVVNKAVDLVGQPSETVTEEAPVSTETLTVVETPSETKSRWAEPNWDENPTSLSEGSGPDAPPAPNPTAPAVSVSGAPTAEPRARMPGKQPVVPDFEGTVVPGNDGD
jgi:cytoskeletal protein RodZ